MMSLYGKYTPTGHSVAGAGTGGLQAVNDWCRAYIGKDATSSEGTCANSLECSDSLKWSVAPGAYWTNLWWDGSGWTQPAPEVAAAKVQAMQAEILQHGPTAAAMMAHPDFFSYKDGVYRVTQPSASPGGHAVVIVGWGVDEDGTKYWIVQKCHPPPP
jgi:hypothetical protein